MTHPMAVTNCNIDMESLIADQNRSIATLAITTLLKTGNEASIDRLLKQVGWWGWCVFVSLERGVGRQQGDQVCVGGGARRPRWGTRRRPLHPPTHTHTHAHCTPHSRAHIQIGGFMSEIADEFKVVVVEAIKALCLKFPQARLCACVGGEGSGLRARARHCTGCQECRGRTCDPTHSPTHPHPPTQKYRGLMGFLSSVLREDGGFDYKKSIVEAILAIIREIPDAKEMGLAQVGGWQWVWVGD